MYFIIFILLNLVQSTKYTCVLYKDCEPQQNNMTCVIKTSRKNGIYCKKPLIHINKKCGFSNDIGTCNYKFKNGTGYQSLDEMYNTSYCGGELVCYKTINNYILMLIILFVLCLLCCYMFSIGNDRERISM